MELYRHDAFASKSKALWLITKDQISKAYSNLEVRETKVTIELEVFNITDHNLDTLLSFINKSTLLFNSLIPRNHQYFKTLCTTCCFCGYLFWPQSVMYRYSFGV